jgi:hypothetical protein
MSHWLNLALVYLAAAVIAVPLARYAGLGSIIGYLVAASRSDRSDSTWSATRNRSCISPSSASC